MACSSGLSRFIHGSSRFDEPLSGRSALDADRHESVSTVRYVFQLIWPHAGIECHAAEAGLRVDVFTGGLHHAVEVPWSLVEFDRGLLLVRAVYRAGLPGALQCAAVGLSLSL